MRTVILIFFIGLTGLSCMKMGEEIPTRVSMTNADHEEQDEVTLLPGMSYKVYPTVFSTKEGGGVYSRSTDQADFLGKVQFDVVDPTSEFFDIEQNGCIVAKKAGNGLLRLSAYSLASGQLDSRMMVNVVPLSKQAQLLRSGVREFGVSEVKAQTGKVYGLVVNDHFHMFDQVGQSLMSTTDGIELEDNLTANDSLNVPILWADPQQSGFIIAYGKKKSDKQFLSYTAIQRNGVRWPVPFDFEMEFSPLRIFGGQFRDTMPLLFSIVQNKDKDGNPSTYSFYAVTQQLLKTKVTEAASTQQGFILDANDQGKEVEINVVSSADLDQVIRMIQDQTGGFTIAYGTSVIHPNPKNAEETKTVNRLKFVRIESSGNQVVSQIEAPQGMTLDDPKGFTMDATGSNPKVLFIQNGRLLFTQRLGGGWVPSFREVGQGAFPQFSPKLARDTEDGTMTAVWKGVDQKINARLSIDGGFSWLDAVSLDITPDQIELIPFPCQGTGLMTVEDNQIKLRFLDKTRKHFLDPIVLASAGGKIKKMMWFKQYQKIRLFFLVQGGELYYLSLL